MTAPIRSMLALEPYRIILDYEAIEDMFLDRIEDLNTTFTQIDDAAGLTRGETQKLLSKSRERWARTLGITSMGKMLKGTGMVLVAVVDDERFAAIKADLIARKRPRKQANASSAKPAWLFTKKKARELGRKRWSRLTPAQRQRLARKMGKASVKARRRKRLEEAKKSGALLTSAQSAPSPDGQTPVAREGCSAQIRDCAAV